MNQKNLYRQILDNLGNAVLLFDRGLRLRFLNPAGEMLLDTSAVKALGQPATALFGSLGQHLAQNLGTTLQTGAPLVERQLPLQQGERTQTVHCAITPVFEGDTVAAAIVEIEPVENYSHLSRDHQAQHQQAAVNQLLRGLAHEIKNPLGGLRGAAQLLAQELDTPQLREYTDVILQEADRLGALIDRLLAPPPTAPETAPQHPSGTGAGPPAAGGRISGAGVPLRLRSQPAPPGRRLRPAHSGVSEPRPQRRPGRGR